VVRDRLRGRPASSFRYRDRGDMATIGRARAVADLRWIRFGGVPAWLFWLGLHLWYLVGGQARAVVLLRWVHGFLTRGRGARLITGARASAA
jgi:NADH dehydrogenase